LVGPSRATGVQVGQILEPVALQAIRQPPQLHHPYDPSSSQAVALAGAVLVDGGGQRR
jgi:hypothetical protein